ncbi:guanine nucleotide binding protein, alpha subunit, partial [Cantharellus anzutake]|uniref:guanine nucleotide binding protein, alpha subunit n=1 Tax=Cantharellus anzutake TaxID=1750568 RepID=UPI00190416A6
FDVGGQRSEMRKWLHFFEDLGVIAFFVALSDYDQVLEWLNRWLSICNSRWLSNSCWIQYPNKIDLLADKIDSKPLGLYVKDYRGREGYVGACAYFRKLVVSIDPRTNAPISCRLKTDG